MGFRFLTFVKVVFPLYIRSCTSWHDHKEVWCDVCTTTPAGNWYYKDQQKNSWQWCQNFSDIVTSWLSRSAFTIPGLSWFRLVCQLRTFSTVQISCANLLGNVIQASPNSLPGKLLRGCWGWASKGTLGLSFVFAATVLILHLQMLHCEFCSQRPVCIPYCLPVK